MHDYLVMDMYFTDKGVVMVKISMTKYIKVIMKDFPDNITKLAVTPAPDHLFQVILDIELMLFMEEQTQIFHSTTVRSLFLSNSNRWNTNI